MLQVRTLPPDTSVGYGASYTTTEKTDVATLGVGYADGVPRLLSGKGNVWFAAGRAPMVGRVSMDLITVDVTDLPDIALGDEVILWGGSLSANLSVNEVANCAGTISYELLTRMPRRTPREYIS